MRKNRLHVLTWLATGCVFFVMSAASCAEETKTTVENLRCEYLTDPIGIDIPGPRLTWNLSSRTHGLRQTAYRIDLGTDSLAVASGEIAGEKTESEDMLVFYTQGEFKPFTKYYWKVTVWANDGEEYVSPVANFEMGMMDRRNWQGEWISDGRSVDEKPAPYFRKEILLNKKVVSARAYITSAGLYALSVNGRRVGDHHLDPMYTTFDTRTLYASYDVSHLLREGENAIGVILGNGWYNHQSTAVWDFEKAYWRGRPSFLLNVRVTYDDGSVQTFVTDRSWKTTDQGPVIFNSIYTAEHYDTRKEMPGWNKHAYADSLWSQSVAVK